VHDAMVEVDGFILQAVCSNSIRPLEPEIDAVDPAILQTMIIDPLGNEPCKLLFC
jgi:hypothetical protein